jgi:flavin reductase (DIM6/NTAB) family NADH-FMN oxidoreductase RutF
MGGLQCWDLTSLPMINSPYLTDAVADSAIGLLLVESGSRTNAMTISCFSEVAHHPTTLWISVAKSAYSHDLLHEAGRFSLAVLNLNQRSIALACGSVSGREIDKCGTLDLYRNEDGFLFLRDALASTSCRVRQSLDIEDHTLFIADILTTDLESRKAHLRHLLLSDLKDS